MKSLVPTIRALTLVLALALALPVFAQDPGVPEGSATARITLIDSSGYLGDRSYEGAQLAWVYLPDAWMPFNEFTQGQWTSSFQKVLDGKEDFPTQTEVWLYGRTPNMTGGSMGITSSNAQPTMVELSEDPPIRKRGVVIDVPDLLLRARIAFAVQYKGVWWPLEREFFFEEDGERSEGVLFMHDVSFDDSQLVIESYNVEVNSIPNEQRPDLRWYKVMVREVIEIRNPSTTHAVIPETALLADGADEFISLPITPPPGVLPSQMYGGDMLSQWTYLAGVRSNTPIPPMGYDRDLTPYRPWSLGQRWDRGETADPHGMMGSGNQPGYAELGAKQSAPSSHPLNQSGVFDLWGAGSVYLSLDEAAGREVLRVVLNKPVPPGQTLRFELVQRPGLDYSNPAAINLPRLPFPYPVENVRLLHDEAISITAASGLQVTPGEIGQDGLVRPEIVSQPGARFELPAGQPFAWKLQPSAALIEAMGEMPAAQEPEAGSGSSGDARANPAGSNDAGANAMQSLGTTVSEPEGSTVVAKHVWWALAATFGLAFLIAMVTFLRPDRDAQLKALRALRIKRKELLAALVTLEHEYEGGKLPPSAYLDERERLTSHLVSMDAAKPQASEK